MDLCILGFFSFVRYLRNFFRGSETIVFGLSIHLSVCPSAVVVTLNFLIGFHPNFIYGWLPSNARSSWKMGFVRQTITKMAKKIAAPVQFACSGHSFF